MRRAVSYFFTFFSPYAFWSVVERFYTFGLPSWAVTVLEGTLIFSLIVFVAISVLYHKSGPKELGRQFSSHAKTYLQSQSLEAEKQLRAQCLDAYKRLTRRRMAIPRYAERLLENPKRGVVVTTVFNGAITAAASWLVFQGFKPIVYDLTQLIQQFGVTYVNQSIRLVVLFTSNTLSLSIVALVFGVLFWASVKWAYDQPIGVKTDFAPLRIFMTVVYPITFVPFMVDVLDDIIRYFHMRGLTSFNIHPFRADKITSLQIMYQSLGDYSNEKPIALYYSPSELKEERYPIEEEFALFGLSGQDLVIQGTGSTRKKRNYEGYFSDRDFMREFMNLHEVTRRRAEALFIGNLDLSATVETVVRLMRQNADAERGTP